MASAYEQDLVPEPIDRRIVALASTQYGVFSRAQVMKLGVTESMIHRRRRTGRWDRLHSGVYRISGAVPSWRQSLMAMCLAWGDGAAISHRTAAPIHGLSGFRPYPIELIVPRGRLRTIEGCIVHRPRALDLVDVMVKDGIPVTTPARTLIDIAGVCTRTVVEEALDEALRTYPGMRSRLNWRLREVGGKGRSGALMLRDLLDARASGVPQSKLETKTLRLILDAGLPQPVIQHTVKDGGRLVAIIDFAYPGRKLAIEADGYQHHSGRVNIEHDRARLNALTNVGWRVIHVTWSDVNERARETTETITAALA